MSGDNQDRYPSYRDADDHNNSHLYEIRTVHTRLISASQKLPVKRGTELLYITPEYVQEGDELLVEAGTECVKSIKKRRPSRNDDRYPSGNGCFPRGTKVSLPDGSLKNIEDLNVGDEVRVIDENGDVHLSTVYALGHKNGRIVTDYIQLNTLNKRLTISHRHFLPVKRGDKVEYIMAQGVQVGDELLVEDGSGTEPVTDIKVVERRGLYAPFTKQGTLIVDGVVVSCYAEVKPYLAHKALAPLRLIYELAPTHLMETIMTPNEEGVPYVLDKPFGLVKSVVTY